MCLTLPCTSQQIVNCEMVVIERPANKTVQLVTLCIQIWILLCSIFDVWVGPTSADRNTLSHYRTCKMYELMWELACRKNNAALYCLMHP